MAQPTKEVHMKKAEAPHPASSSTRTSFWTTLVLTVIATYLLSRVIRPFAAALFIAAVLAGAVSPLYERLAARMGGRRNLASGVATLTVLLVVILPLAWLAVVLAQEVADGVSYVRRTLRSEGVGGLVADLPAPLRAAAQKVLDRLPQDQEELTQVAGAQGGRAASAVGGFVQATWSAVVQMVMMLIAFFFMLVDGPKLVNWVVEVLPLRRKQTLTLLTDFRKVTVAVLVSSIATSAIQAAVALIGYLLAKVPNPMFFGFVTFLVGLVPAVGAAAVTLGAALILFLSGHPGAALFLVIWAIPVGLADNVVKPYLIRSGIQLHGAVVFFSLVGGLAYFGPVGLLAGPLIVSFFIAVVHMWTAELDDADERSSAPLLPHKREAEAEA
jgi:predicted PurR-regulated permease PerM